MSVAIQQIVDWLDERIDLSEIRHFVAEKGVPIHAHKVWYYLGGMTLFLFGVQVFTGILLLLYYRPSSAEAYESVQFIVTQVQFGWLIRNVHSWSANLLILFAFAHFFSVFFLKSYRKPRELTWLTGILLLFLMLGFGFSGYLLPWNALSFFATKVGTGIAGAVPFGAACPIMVAHSSRRTRTTTAPLPVSSVISSRCRALAATIAAPSTGCPAKGSSAAGVNMRMATSPSCSGASTNTVSESFSSRARRCMSSAEIPRASVNTASWLPSSGVSVKTSSST